ncbi:MAG: LD-carboxypeptidase [Sandaracinaceae bacterium]|nr:LD-carboxypeptidase [Sandaracinaceae bacterium]
MIAPSSPFDRAAFERGVERLSKRYEVRYDESIFARQGYFAGDDTRRLDEIRRVIADESVEMIVAARGGYGATRLLPAIDIAAVSNAEKLLVGFSDITALHALWQRAGVQSIHGPMICALGDQGEEGSARFERWVDTVEGRALPPFANLSCIVAGEARGPVFGGNLSVLCAMVGSPYAPKLDDAIVFIEDIGERPYRVDRMLTGLLQSGFFARVAGVAVGHFTESKVGADAVTVEEVIRERLSSLSVPVVSGLPCGHVDDNAPLPFGAAARLDATRGTLTFEAYE